MRLRNPLPACFLSVFLVLPAFPACAGNVGANCTLEGKALYGRVQVVNAFPDLKVQKVTACPDRCGRWQFVDSFPDFRIQFVNAFPDLRIQSVDAFPGN